MVQEIFAAANRDSKRPGVTLLPQLEEQYGERSVEAHLLRRVYANIEIRSDETDELVTCLAVAYHQKGIQLGIGPMVRVCHNQTILGAQDVVSNYTCYGGQSRKDKLSLESVIGRAELWADEYEPYQKIRRERMNALKSAEFTRTDMLQLIGILVEKRILHDTQNEELHLSTPYPLNSSQINETSEQMITLMSHQQPQSYWDAYQQLNTVLKPGRMDIPQVLPQSKYVEGSLHKCKLTGKIVFRAYNRLSRIEEGSYHPPTGERLAEGECDTHQVLQLGEEGSRVPTGERGDAP